MFLSRGLQWSGQTICRGQRRLDIVSVRQYSSTIHHASPRNRPLVSQTVTAIPRRRPVLPLALVHNGLTIRFASTSPSTTAAAPGISPAAQVTNSASSTPLTDYTTSLDPITNIDSGSLLNIPEQIGYLKAMGLDYGWGPTAVMEWTLEHVHIYTDTPWWASIAITAVAIRVILFKAYVEAAENSTRLAYVQPITKPLMAKMQALSKAGLSHEAMQVRGEMQRVHKRAGVKMYKNFVPMLQAVTGYGTFVILRSMSKLPVPGLESGGLLWFYDLTIPDPYYFLPLAGAGVLHWLLRKGGETAVNTMSPQVQSAMMWGLPTLSLLFTYWLPASVQLSFLVTSICSLAQSTLLKQQWVRNYFNMTSIPQPKLEGPPPSPYKGNLKIAGNPVLSQADLNSRFRQAQSNRPEQAAIREIRKPTPFKGAGTQSIRSATGAVDNFRKASENVKSAEASKRSKTSKKTH